MFRLCGDTKDVADECDDTGSNTPDKRYGHNAVHDKSHKEEIQSHGIRGEHQIIFFQSTEAVNYSLDHNNVEIFI